MVRRPSPVVEGRRKPDRRAVPAAKPRPRPPAPTVSRAPARPARRSGPRTPDPGPRIAWASPLPPTRSGVSDYAAELLPELARLGTLTVVEPPGWTAPDDAPWLAGLRRVSDASDDDAGVPLLHLGNNPYHLWIARRLRLRGGVVVLHDPVLHHLLVEEAAADGEWGRFARELGDAHGRAGEALAEARRWGINGPLDPFLFPARPVYLRHARAVVVHSREAERRLAAELPGMPVRRVPLAVAALPCGDRTAWRRRLGCASDTLVLAHLGFLTPAKGLEALLLTLASLTELRVDFRLVVVGEGSEASTLDRAVAALGLGERVTRWGFASFEELGGIAAATDLGLVPRYPTAGETSAAALRFLAAGTPVAVAAYGQFLELPHAAALRMAPGRAGVVDLLRWVAALSASAALRAAAREAAARAWREGGHDPGQAAQALVAALGELDAKHVAARG